MARTRAQATYRVLWYGFAAFFSLDFVSYALTGSLPFAAYTGVGSLLLFSIPRVWPGWWRRKTGSSDIGPEC